MGETPKTALPPQDRAASLGKRTYVALGDNEFGWSRLISISNQSYKPLVGGVAFLPTQLGMG
ncbi:MAG: hypothetical protein F6J99_09750 [Moorea sp. SIO4G3]|nr:hypothetical protein [Moorena sp. SIO4G3]